MVTQLDMLHSFLFTFKAPMFTSIFQDQSFLIFPLSFSLHNTPPQPGKPPTVTPILLFPTAWNVVSHRCRFAWWLSAKKQLYTTNTLLRTCQLLTILGFNVLFQFKIFSKKSDWSLENPINQPLCIFNAYKNNLVTKTSYAVEYYK